MIIRYGVSGILLFFLVVLSANLSVAQSDLGKIKCVCIDAGHGGTDPGAIGTKAYEKNIVLAIALKLGKLIETTYPDVKVVYIRKTDVFVELKERSRVANKHKADLFISVHANALDIKKYPKLKSIKGVETFLLGSGNASKHNLQVAMKENSVIHYENDYSIKYEGFDPSRAESYILFNILQSVHFDKSLTLASMVHEELVKDGKRVDREVQQAPFWVLKDVAMPSVLVEVGYITNPDDERYMQSVAGQAKIAEGIFKGFQKYKTKMEKNITLKVEAENAEKKVEPKKISPASTNGTNFDAPIYAIQVASATARIKNCSTLCTGQKVCELNSEGRFRYYVLPSENLEAVKGKLKTVKGKVKDCFIIAIYKGKIIPVTEARKLEQNK